ncbi:hypothetical protein N7481_002741 [Penicillium waksmanii]|uniref:uncharacterized protein n=1 Tax=Penicillium waksmanii TaxID=69791 RepID=UPI0025471CDD|nr:uncharacterized protein N7481_002741 [Penicillium waksmanii]KAJ5995764.1 hypothetical protein N7481_002741 [Penicillium waksmanii]
MVLDPLSSLSLACTVCQFLEFSGTLFSKSHKIYKSATGYDEDTDSLLGITRDLRSLTDKLEPPIHSKSLSAEETELANLGDRCKKTADELLLVLGDLQDSKTSRWSSFRAALKTVWTHDRIDEMARKLESYRSQLILRLTIMQSSNGSNVRVMNKLLETNHLIRGGLAPSIEGLRITVMESMETLRADFERQSRLFMLALEEDRNEKNKPQLQLNRQHEIRQLEALQPVDITAITQKIQNTALATNMLATELFIMRTLRFDGMELRRSQVSEAHKRTYRWAYMSNFSEWMVSEDPLFWISGKPGSGKSTLMKYLVNSPDTYAYLRKWAGTRKLVIIDYFFWINGSDIHRSQEGLLRSLLFDIFQKCPELIQKKFPERWGESVNMSLDLKGSMISWNRQELLSGLQRITQQTTLSNAFCIFIDGLDEYEGEHEDLLCVASRPWNVFEKALGTDPSRKIYLEHLNKPDIELYVKNTLQDRADFQALAMSDPDATELALDIVQRSNGVFLWVYLVVLLVKQGLVNEDRLVDLKRRVSAYPADLNNFFKHIMDSLDPLYQAQIATGFSVALAAREPLSIVSFWYLDELELDSNVAIAKKIDEPAVKSNRLDSFWRDEVRKMEARLNGRFKGLLEIVKMPKWEVPSDIMVEFLHRTVRDFLTTEECQRALKDWTPTGFDVHSALCNIQLAEIKELHPKLAELSTLKRLAEGTFYSAQQFEKYHQRSLNKALEHLERTIDSYGLGMSPWEELEVRSFTMYAVMSNLTGYISHLLETGFLSDMERLRCLRKIFDTTRDLSADVLHDPEPKIAVIENPLNMIILLAETRPLTKIPFNKILTGLEVYDTSTIVSILRCLCKNGHVDIEQFQLLAPRVRRLTSSWDAKELEEMIRPGKDLATRTIRSDLSRKKNNTNTKEKGRLHSWLGKIKYRQ